MILNVFSIIEIFINMISLIVMGWSGILAFIIVLRWKRSQSPSERSSLEDISYLVLLSAIVVLGIRLLNWPLFYACLQSFVPDIEGAMCIFGVTQVKRVLTNISEIIKPISFFLAGAWLIVHQLDQKTKTASLMSTKLIFLVIMSLFIIIESLIDIILMIQISPGKIVSCCTTVTDILNRQTRLVPKVILGPKYSLILGFAFYILTILQIFFLYICLKIISSNNNFRWRLSVLGFMFFFSICNSVLFILSQIEFFAPKIMGLPFHHCLYCLWQYVPDTILMYSLFILGTSAIGWSFFIDLVARSKETIKYVADYICNLYKLAMFCLTACILMNSVHILICS